MNMPEFANTCAKGEKTAVNMGSFLQSGSVSMSL